jgi:hypothetical protein
MFNGLKNFAIRRVLRHVADNPKLNQATNLLALIPVMITAALTVDADWMKLFSGDVHEIVRVAVPVLTAALLWVCGKATWLKQWLPVAEDIIAEAGRELEKAKPTAKGK